MAQGEEKAYSGNIDQSKKTNAHQRAESLRDIYGKGLNWIVRAIFIVLLATIIIVAWHHLMPSNWRWLHVDELGDIKTFLFSGAVISAVSLQIQRIM